MCPYNPEGQPNPGLHRKKCGQQVEAGDPAPVLWVCKTSSGVLYPDVEYSVQVSTA